MGIDLSRFKVIHGGMVLNAIALMEVRMPDDMDYSSGYCLNIGIHPFQPLPPLFLIGLFLHFGTLHLYAFLCHLGNPCLYALPYVNRDAFHGLFLYGIHGPEHDIYNALVNGLFRRATE